MDVFDVNYVTLEIKPCGLGSRIWNMEAEWMLKVINDLISWIFGKQNWHCGQRYTYRVLQTIQMKLIPLCVWAEPAVLGSTKTTLKIKHEI